MNDDVADVIHFPQTLFYALFYFPRKIKDPQQIFKGTYSLAQCCSLCSRQFLKNESHAFFFIELFVLGQRYTDL